MKLDKESTFSLDDGCSRIMDSTSRCVHSLYFLAENAWIQIGSINSNLPKFVCWQPFSPIFEGKSRTSSPASSVSALGFQVLLIRHATHMPIGLGGTCSSHGKPFTCLSLNR